MRISIFRVYLCGSPFLGIRLLTGQRGEITIWARSKAGLVLSEFRFKTTCKDLPRTGPCILLLILQRHVGCVILQCLKFLLHPTDGKTGDHGL